MHHRKAFAILSLAMQAGNMLVPHVEATIMATDRVGLGVLQKAKCFDCYSTWHEAKMKGEIAASSAILKANYNLDAFLPPYQNVNWQDKRAWPCAATHMPQQQQDQRSGTGLLTNIVEVGLSFQMTCVIPVHASRSYLPTIQCIHGTACVVNHDGFVGIQVRIGVLFFYLISGLPASLGTFQHLSPCSARV